MGNPKIIKEIFLVADLTAGVLLVLETVEIVKFWYQVWAYDSLLCLNFLRFIII